MKIGLWIIAWYGLLAAHFVLWWAGRDWGPVAADGPSESAERSQVDASVTGLKSLPAEDWKIAVERIFAAEERLRQGGAEVAVYAPLVDWIERHCAHSPAVETAQWQGLVAATADWMSAIATASEQLEFERCNLLPDADGLLVLLLDGTTAAASLGRWLSNEGYLASPWNLRELEIVRIGDAPSWWFHGVWAVRHFTLP